MSAKEEMIAEVVEVLNGTDVDAIETRLRQGQVRAYEAAQPPTPTAEAWLEENMAGDFRDFPAA